MYLVRQPANSNLCGQACVATLCNATLEAATAACGKKGKTYTRDVAKAIRSFGVSCGDKRLIHRSKCWNSLPDKTLMVVAKKGKVRHWIIWHKGKFYDPAAGVFRTPPKYLTENGAEPVSYLEVSIP